jgi:hypothetical protein
MNKERKLFRLVRFITRCAFLGYLPRNYPKSVPNKYILTQLSGVVVGLIVPILALLFLEPFGVNFTHFTASGFSGSKFIIGIVVLWSTFFASIYLWGKILCLIGILKWEEAKGFPYSKPWEKM